jgi:hypothetical protein
MKAFYSVDGSTLPISVRFHIKKPSFRFDSVFVGVSDEADVTNEMKVRLKLKQLQPTTKSL